MLPETRQFLLGAMPTQSRSKHIWLPTASGPMPLVVEMLTSARSLDIIV